MVSGLLLWLCESNIHPQEPRLRIPFLLGSQRLTRPFVFCAQWPLVFVVTDTPLVATLLCVLNYCIREDRNTVAR